MYENKEIKLSYFLEANEHLETGGSVTLEEIVEKMFGSQELMEVKMMR